MEPGRWWLGWPSTSPGTSNLLLPGVMHRQGQRTGNCAIWVSNSAAGLLQSQMSFSRKWPGLGAGRAGAGPSSITPLLYCVCVCVGRGAFWAASGGLYMAICPRSRLMTPPPQAISAQGPTDKRQGINTGCAPQLESAFLSLGPHLPGHCLLFWPLLRAPAYSLFLPVSSELVFS